MDIAHQLIGAFARTVRMNGGTLSLVSADVGMIRLGYAPGVDEACDAGTCVLPHLELQQMMREWLSRRDPTASVTVQLLAAPAS